MKKKKVFSEWAVGLNAGDLYFCHVSLNTVMDRYLLATKWLLENRTFSRC